MVSLGSTGRRLYQRRLLSRCRQRLRLATDQSNERLRELRSQFSEVYALIAVSRSLQRGVFDWQNRAEDAHMIFWPDLVPHLDEVDTDLPADTVPVHTGRPKLLWPRTLIAIGHGYSDSIDQRVKE